MKIRNIMVSLITLVTFISFACGENSPVESSMVNDQSSLEVLKQTIVSLPTEELSDGEISGLLVMREEEKLARDVYITLYQKYGLRVFDNISRSEQTHTNAIRLLIEKYRLEDPVTEDEIGIFRNQDLQNLYNQLIEKGNVSEVEALKVGAEIEEIDILDLVEQIEKVVDNQDITYVYNNLKAGSENHLRAFVRNLSMRGVTYSPTHLDVETYNLIINN